MSDILETMREYKEYAETKSVRGAFAAVINEIIRLRKSNERLLSLIDGLNIVAEVREKDSTRLRADLAAVTEERDRMREALEPFAARDCALPNDDMVHSNISFKVKDIRRARIALEGETHKI